MSKGFLVLAQNTKTTDYVKQAYALALSLKNSNNYGISLVTNDEVPDAYKKVFDQIIPIPFGDQAANSEWKVENRWKLYHVTPYDETIVFDADVLVFKNLDYCWKFAKGKNLIFTNSVTNYKGQVVKDSPYRETFVKNDLPNVYTGMFYFKKSEYSLTFFKLLQTISSKWNLFLQIAPKATQTFFSMDLAAAIAIKILGIDDEVLFKNSPFSFVHMKPALQGWTPVPSSCYSQVLVNFNIERTLTVGGFRQDGVFHYVEPEFLTESMLEKLHV